MKKLPITIPPITTFPGYADILAVLFCYPNSYEWIYSNYLQVFAIDIPNRTLQKGAIEVGFFSDIDYRCIYNRDQKNSFFRIQMCPFLYFKSIPNRLVKMLKFSFIDFVKDCIDNGQYIFLYINPEKISAYNRNQNYYHEMFIYGYDDSKQTIYFTDFPINSNTHYDYGECSFEELEESYSFYLQYPKSAQYPVVLIQYTEEPYYEFDYSYIQKSVKEYLYPNKTKETDFTQYIQSIGHEKYIYKAFIGINVYKYFEEFIDFEFNLKRKYLDIRLYHALYEHKVMMLKRFEFLSARGYLSDNKSQYFEKYNEVKENTLIIRNKILKFNITHNMKTVGNLPEILNGTKELEFELLNRIFLQ